jgi:hypothetical protein
MLSAERPAKVAKGIQLWPAMNALVKVKHRNTNSSTHKLCSPYHPNLLTPTLLAPMKKRWQIYAL